MASQRSMYAGPQTGASRVRLRAFVFLGGCDVNLYRIIGDAIATLEARDLAEQLVSWHDAMVKHLRVVAARGQACTEDCPHEQAQYLWTQALEVFGDDADKLAFLRTHGVRPPARRPVRPVGLEAHA